MNNERKLYAIKNKEGKFWNSWKDDWVDYIDINGIYRSRQAAEDEMAMGKIIEVEIREK